jgi:uncharacterized membrane protein
MATEEQRLGVVKTTVLGAVLVVVPVGIVGFALWQVASIIRKMILPLAERLPFDSAVTRIGVVICALAAVVLACFLTGLAVRTRWGAIVRQRIERRLLEKIPGYSMIRTLAHQYLGHEGQRQFRPVLVDLYGSDSRAIGFEIEALGDGTVAVFLPSVPAVTIGQVQIVPEGRLTPLTASMHHTLEALAMFGVGAAKLMEDSSPPVP